MNSWAAGATYDCNFLCICVLGDRTAYNLCKEMSTQMKLTHCVNGFVASPSDMPTYGQLGCQGFIILDKEHNVISQGTTPFMQVRAMAFQHVEALLDAVCNNSPLPSICPGEMGELIDAPAGEEKLKGMRGVCIKVANRKVDFGFMEGPMRGNMISVDESMVRRVTHDEESSAGGCSTGTCSVGGTCATGDCGQSGASDCKGGSCASGSCKPGKGCDPSSCDKAECKIDPAFVDEILNIHSVKVDSMDAEHAMCSKTLRGLVEKRSKESLQDVLECLEDHFEHEEELFDQFGFGVHVNEKLSARKSHAAEHHRLLEKVRGQLGGASATISAAFIKELLQDFHEHTTLYDMQYADFLAQEGAR